MTATERAELPLGEQPVTYAAVGATQAEDLLAYPPAGFRPIERRIRLGHGEARWRHAWTETLTWGIQRRSGMRVRSVEPPPDASAEGYTPVLFDRAGDPVAPAAVGDEIDYAPDGTALLRAGDTAALRIGLWPRDVPVRVVYVVDEPARRGFAYGTLPGHPESGEEAFVVERRPDDSVWLTVRAFSRPATAWLRLAAPALRLAQELYTARYLGALAGPLGDEAPA